MCSSDLDWIIYGLVKAGYNLPKTVKKDYIFSVKGKLKRYEGEIGRQPTDYVRTSLALWALNENPAAIQGYDLTSQFKGLKKIKDQGLNSVIYSLIGLNFVKKHKWSGRHGPDRPFPEWRPGASRALASGHATESGAQMCRLTWDRLLVRAPEYLKLIHMP